MRRWVLLLTAMILPFLCWYDQNFRIRVRQIELRSSTIDAPVRIVHISDLHGLNWGADNERLVGMIAAQQPDIICATGDMYTRSSASGQRIAENLMARLCTVAPTFFVPGEHDHAANYLQKLTDAGVRIPDSSGTAIRMGDSQLQVFGCSAAWFPENADYSARYAAADPDTFRLLLCHIPMPQAFSGTDIDLMLSGDTHGGVIRLPLLGAVFDGRRWLPEWRNTENCWIYGQYAIGEMTLSVTSGLGGVPARLFAPPEICVITLTPQ